MVLQLKQFPGNGLEFRAKVVLESMGKWFIKKEVGTCNGLKCVSSLNDSENIIQTYKKISEITSLSLTLCTKLIQNKLRIYYSCFCKIQWKNQNSGWGKNEKSRTLE